MAADRLATWVISGAGDGGVVTPGADGRAIHRLLQALVSRITTIKSRIKNAATFAINGSHLSNRIVISLPLGLCFVRSPKVRDLCLLSRSMK